MTFLIRTKENRISGPFPKEVILERMQSGELREMDEICPASGYWIYLHEREESMKALGVALARKPDFHEDATETETETVTATQPLTAPVRGAGAPGGTFVARPTPVTRNRPEPVRTLRFVVWIFLAVLVFILWRVYQIAIPA